MKAGWKTDPKAQEGQWTDNGSVPHLELVGKIPTVLTLEIKVKAMKARTTTRHGKQPALTDWRELDDGEVVNILKNAKSVTQGRVDEVSGSGGVLWILDDKAETQAFFKSDGVFVMRR